MNLNNNKFKPGLYCVATPIGNMGDISFRAVKILQESDLILCEDTRVTKKILQKFEINKKLISNHEFNEKKNLDKVLEILKNKKIVFDKGLIKFKNSIFDIDFSVLINDSQIPINIEGSIPINKSENLDLRLIGNGQFIDLIDIFADEYFTFKEGQVNLRMIIKGSLNKPILNGFIVIKDSEIDFYNNIIKDINSLIIFDFDSLEIKNLKAKAEDYGDISIRGSLPF